MQRGLLIGRDSSGDPCRSRARSVPSEKDYGAKIVSAKAVKTGWQFTLEAQLEYVRAPRPRSASLLMASNIVSISVNGRRVPITGTTRPRAMISIVSINSARVEWREPVIIRSLVTSPTGLMLVSPFPAPTTTARL